MRCTQDVGLNKRGHEYIIKNIDHEFKIGSGEILKGMFGEDSHICNTYVHQYNGRIFEEYLQLVCCSSGAMLFLALRWQDTKQPIKETLWKPDESVKDIEYDIKTGKYWL
jgi:hypothetical protein